MRKVPLPTADAAPSEYFKLLFYCILHNMKLYMKFLYKGARSNIHPVSHTFKSWLFFRVSQAAMLTVSFQLQVQKKFHWVQHKFLIVGRIFQCCLMWLQLLFLFDVMLLMPAANWIEKAEVASVMLVLKIPFGLNSTRKKKEFKCSLNNSNKITKWIKHRVCWRWRKKSSIDRKKRIKYWNNQRWTSERWKTMQILCQFDFLERFLSFFFSYSSMFSNILISNHGGCWWWRNFLSKLFILYARDICSAVYHV